MLVSWFFTRRENCTKYYIIFKSKNLPIDVEIFITVIIIIFFCAILFVVFIRHHLINWVYDISTNFGPSSQIVPCYSWSAGSRRVRGSGFEPTICWISIRVLDRSWNMELWFNFINYVFNNMTVQYIFIWRVANENLFAWTLLKSCQFKRKIKRTFVIWQLPYL